MKKVITPAVLTLLSLTTCFLLNIVNLKAQTITSEPGTSSYIISPPVVVSASIGVPKMTIWGYGPPSCSVELSGVGVEQKIISQADGYYSFDIVYLMDSPTFPELCITAIDQERRATPPTCIPAIGGGNYFYNVGPVILPPTISIGAPETHPGSQVSAQGVTIPNSTIEVKLARPDSEEGKLGFHLVRTAHAYYIPSYTVLSDANGSYSFNMPTTTGITWRVFTITDYEGGNKSPKSNTLKFVTITPITFVWRSFWKFLATLLVWPRLLFLEILLIIVLILIVVMILKKKKKRYQKTSEIVERYQNYLSKANSS